MRGCIYARNTSGLLKRPMPFSFSGRGFGGARYKMNLGHIFNSKYHRDDADVRWLATGGSTGISPTATSHM